MEAIKNYTDIEQSKVLAKILLLESADMYYWLAWSGGVSKEKRDKPKVGKPNKDAIKTYWLPCWSLSALLDVMPKDKSIECSISFGYYNGKGEYIEKWLCAFEKEGETTDDFIIETFDGDNPVDACVDMIKRLYELNLL